METESARLAISAFSQLISDLAEDLPYTHNIFVAQRDSVDTWRVATLKYVKWNQGVRYTIRFSSLKLFFQPTEQLIMAFWPDKAYHRQPTATRTLRPVRQLMPPTTAAIEFPWPITKTRTLVQLPNQLNQLRHPGKDRPTVRPHTHHRHNCLVQ
jgi:hypothetical protein